MSRPLLTALAAAVALSACASDTAGVAQGGASASSTLKAGLALVMPGSEAAQTAPQNPEALAQAALSSVKGPVMLATFEASGATMVFGMVGENGAMRSYNSPDQRGIVLRNGMLAATRGFGEDLMSADTEGVAKLVTSRSAGTAERVQRYLDGDGTERPVPMRCAVSIGQPVSQTLSGIAYSGVQVAEHCEGSGAVVDNGYLVSTKGRVLVSRQWAGPSLGYVMFQSLRD